MIYLDNAATTLQKPKAVIDAVVNAMTTMGNASRGAHPNALSAARTVYEARCKLARFFGCGRPDHVIFTSNATAALNITLNGLFSRGDHVITTDLEHNSVLRPLYHLEETGVISLSFLRQSQVIPLDFEAISAQLRPETRAIVCTHASNLTGDGVDLAALGRFAHEHGLLLVADVAQTAGALPIHMEKMGIDVLCFTGHKGLLGPQGTGGLCIREGVDIRPLLLGGSGVHSYDRRQPVEYPTRLEAGTLNTHGIAGLSAALDYLESTGIETIHRHEAGLMTCFCEAVKQIDGVTVYGDFSRPRAAIVALNIRDYDSAAVSDALAETYGIATRPGAHCAPRMHQSLGTTEQGAVRFSFSWFNTMEDVRSAISAIRELTQEA